MVGGWGGDEDLRNEKEGGVISGRFFELRRRRRRRRRLGWNGMGWDGMKRW